MLGIVATIKTKPGQDEAALQAHRGTAYFKDLGRKMGEHMDGRAQVLSLREVCASPGLTGPWRRLGSVKAVPGGSPTRVAMDNFA